MPGVDAVLAKGWIDKGNLFVCGGSGGGVLTAWIVGHMNRFRAVSMRPVIDHQVSWGGSRAVRRALAAALCGQREDPHHGDDGEADLRTPITQSEEFYRALKLLKKDTLLVRMSEEFHGWRRPSHRVMQQLYMMAWFEKWKK